MRSRWLIGAALLIFALGGLVAAPQMRAHLYVVVYDFGAQSARLWAVDRLDGLGEPGLEGLILALGDEERSVAERAGERLERRGVPKLAPRLILALDRDKNRDRRLQILLLRHLDEIRMPLLAALDSEEPRRRRGALSLLVSVLGSRMGRGYLAKTSEGYEGYRDLYLGEELLLDRVSLRESSIEAFAEPAVFERLKAGLDDPDRDIRFRCAILRPADEPPLELLLDTPPRSQVIEDLARLDALAQFSTQRLTQAVAEAPERRSLNLLAAMRSLPEPGVFELEGVSLLLKLAPLLARDQPAVAAALERRLAAFRAKKEPGWPRDVYLLDALKNPPEPYLDALLAIDERVDRGDAREAVLAVLAGATEAEARAAFQERILVKLLRRGRFARAALKLCARRGFVLDGEAGEEVEELAKDPACEDALVLYRAMLAREAGGEQ